MGDLLDDIIQYIIANSLANKKDSDIFKDYSPKEPDNCIIVYEYAGSSPAPFTDISVRSIQIVCRAKDNKIAKPKCWSIYKLFHKEDLMIQLNARKCIIEMRNTPIKIGVDEQNRNLWAFNFALTTNLD